MRLLFIIPYVPTLNRGRSYHLIQSLAAQGHRMTLACLGMDTHAADSEARTALLEFCDDVKIVPFSQFESVTQCARYVATSTPLWAASCFSAAFDALLERMITTETFDLAHVVRLRGAGLSRRIHHNRIPMLFDAVECVTEAYSQYPQDADMNSFGQSFSRNEQAKLRRYEPKIASGFVRTLLATEYDERRLMELADSAGSSLALDVLPNGTDLECFRPMKHVPILPGNILISGKLHYAANRDAARFFCHEIFPAVRQAHPLATLTLIGGASATDLQALASQHASGIEIVERAADLRPYIARAALVVCPLRVGTGAKSNVLETMAMGKALVATPLAARPMDNSAPGNSLCVAETPLAFATQIMHLLSHPEEVARLGGNARQYMEENHDWSKLTERLTAMYEQIASGEDTEVLVS